MSWQSDRLGQSDRLLYRGQYAKTGRFQCPADHPEFHYTPAIDNDVLVLPLNPIWISRNCSDYWYTEPGSVLLHGSGSELSRQDACGRGDDAIWFGIHPEVFEATLSDNGWDRQSLGESTILTPELRLSLGLLLRDIGTGECDQAELDERVLELFRQVCSTRTGSVHPARRRGSRTTERHRKLVERTRAYLEHHLSENLDLDEIAKAVGSSVFHLCRVFRTIMGVSLHGYRTQRRLGMVLDRLLGNESVCLTELALDAGFSSHSHMTRSFVSLYGLSPSALLRQGARRYR